MIDIVPYCTRHQSGVVDVILPIQQSEFGIPITLVGQPDLLDIPGFYQKGSGNFWLALNGAEVVGTIALLDIGQGRGALRKMFVKARFRGAAHGIAGRLLRIVLDWSRDKGIHEIFLGTTAEFLAAHRFYEKNGFAQISPAELPASFPVMSVDTKFYRMEINPQTL
ncbi:MAG: GNAT family N-acetyltransferase [Desulfosarcinaceae bacterium]